MEGVRTPGKGEGDERRKKKRRGEK